MLNWIFTLLRGSSDGFKISYKGSRSRKIADLEARLVAAPGKPLRGELECEAWENGDWKIDIEIDHPHEIPAGPWQIFVNGKKITEMQPSMRHETEKTMRSDRDMLAFKLEPGMPVEVRNREGVMLSGTLQVDF